jgi:hypothetical protein
MVAAHPRPFLTRFGAGLALAAVLLQLLLSFAHVHPPPLSPTANGGQPGWTDHQSRSGQPDSPLEAEDCAICASIAAFATLDLPASVVATIALQWLVCVLPALPAWRAETSPYRFFHTRAPPSA